MGNCYLKKEMFEDAIVCYKKQIEINPKHEEAHNGLGLVYESKSMLDEAILSYK